MKTRFASAMFALAVPALAQTPAPTPAPATTTAPAATAPAATPATESLFYKAFYLERGERDKAKAMVLYEQFLSEAPDHPLAKQAATFQFELLTSTGKAKEAEVFAKKYEKLLGNVAVGAPAAGDTPAAAGEHAPGAGGQGGRARGQRGGAAPGGNPQERVAELKKQIDEAKAAGDEAKQKQLEQELQRVERFAQGGAGAGAGGQGAGGPGGRRGGMMQVKKFAEMSKEELDTFKSQTLEGMSSRLERMRQNGMEDQAKQLEENITALKKALADNKLEDAQKVWDKMAAAMRGRRGGGGGGR